MERVLERDRFRIRDQRRIALDMALLLRRSSLLVSGLFEQSRSLCERAFAMEGPASAKSELAEWLAISQSKLGFPSEAVRKSFDASIRLDPSNERARRNLAAFEAATQASRASLYEIRNKSAIRASGLSERRLRPAA